MKVSAYGAEALWWVQGDVLVGVWGAAPDSFNNGQSRALHNGIRYTHSRIGKPAPGVLRLAGRDQDPMRSKEEKKRHV
jgi:hypothetical protein